MAPVEAARVERRIPRERPFLLGEFLHRVNIASFASAEDGLRALGWRICPKDARPEIQAGHYGSIQLAYKLREGQQRIPIERRQLTLIKVMKMQEYRMAWTEADIMRGIVHENVVTMIDWFAVVPPADSLDDSGIPLPRQIYTLMEYANAGDLEIEVGRYTGDIISEHGSKYYMLQICAGVRYIHSKDIVHNDLHARNVVLKYNRDLTKTCMICDFGLADIVDLDPDCADLLPSRIGNRADVHRVCLLARFMMQGNNTLQFIQMRLTREALQVLEGAYSMNKAPRKIDDLLKLKWFQSPGQPPTPPLKAPSPLVRPVALPQMNYLPQVHPSGVYAETPPRRPGFMQRARQSLEQVGTRVASRFRRNSDASTGSGPTEASEPQAGPSGLAASGGTGGSSQEAQAAAAGAAGAATPSVMRRLRDQVRQSMPTRLRRMSLSRGGGGGGHS